MSWLFLYKIVFTTELLIAELLLTFHYPKRKGFAYLAPLALILCYGAVILFPEYLVNGWIASSLMFIFFFSISIVGLLICFEVKFVNLLFCAVAAYTVQHLSYVIFSLINVVLLDGQAFTSMAYDNADFAVSTIGGMTAFSFIIYFVLYFFIYLLAYALLRNRIMKEKELKFKSIIVIVFVVSVLLIDIVFSDIYRYTPIPASISYFIEVFYSVLSIALCVCLLCLQMSMIKAKDIESEMEIMSRFYNEQQKHYQIRKETIDLINIKCHDFRHQIRKIGSNRGIDNGVVEEMQSIISLYDADISTGNEVLDVMLTEKSLLCRDKGIDFTCIVDGKLLAFMKDSDLYALFGNILDNAIEAVDVVEDATKRRVNFIVENHKGLIFIREDNYFVGNIFKDENGLIYTTKDDKRYHGFGIKSIQVTVEKYGGIVQVETNGDIFQLSILFYEKQ